MLYVCVILKMWFTRSFFQTGVQSMRIFILNNWNEFINFWDWHTQYYLTEVVFSCSRTMRDPKTHNRDKNSGIERNRTATTPSIQPRSCAFRLPSVLIQRSFIAWKKFRKQWSCGNVPHRILRIKNQRQVPSRENKPRWMMAQDCRIWWSLLWRVV